jgi:hypothetical protein
VHVLAEHRELLGQVAVQRDFLVARLRRDALLRPVLEGVGAAAGDADVQAVAGGHQGVADLAQLGQQAGMPVCTLELISIMLSRDLGRHVAGEGLARASRCSRSGLAGVRSKSDRLTSCSSSSTPKVSGDSEVAKVQAA